jgi:hypothetical protein
MGQGKSWAKPAVTLDKSKGVFDEIIFRLQMMKNWGHIASNT